MKDKKKKIFTCLMFSFMCFLMKKDVYATTIVETSLPYVEGEVIVVKEANSNENISEILEENIEGTEESVQFAVVELEENVSVSQGIDLYENIPGVAYAQPNYIYEEETIEEESTYYNNQWYITNLNMNATWDVMDKFPTNKVRTVVLDSGFDSTHEDLKPNVNSSLCVDASMNPISYQPVYHGIHGTHIAGIIGAVNDNNLGIQGMASNRAELISVCINDGTRITTSSVARGIDYAISIHTRVMNASVGAYTDDQILREAMDKAYNAGIFVTSSAGNRGINEDHYPSKYSSCVGVINTTSSNLRNSNSNYGADNFISAPGTGIYSTSPENYYTSNSGTSMASAVVAGVAVNILSINPDLTIEQLKTILAKTATDIYSTGFDVESGWGIINPYAAVDCVVGGMYSTEEYVKRMYLYCLNREPDETGLGDWTNRLNQGKVNGAQAAQGFLFSEEFLNRNVGNVEYVELLYRCFFDSEGDIEGNKYWVEKLDNGMSRLYVMNGFTQSTQFNNLCKLYGIVGGNTLCKEARDKNEEVTKFVTRLYTKALDRPYDVEGLNDWCGRILNKSWSIYKVSTNGFFHSEEFANKNTSNSEFVEILYRTFLGREYDEAGYQDWVNQLEQGKSRDYVIAGFANSKEFSVMCDQIDSY